MRCSRLHLTAAFEPWTCFYVHKMRLNPFCDLNLTLKQGFIDLSCVLKAQPHSPLIPYLYLCLHGTLQRSLPDNTSCDRTGLLSPILKIAKWEEGDRHRSISTWLNWYLWIVRWISKDNSECKPNNNSVKVKKHNLAGDSRRDSSLSLSSYRLTLIVSISPLLYGYGWTGFHQMKMNVAQWTFRFSAVCCVCKRKHFPVHLKRGHIL